jgi:hypothetical protein
VRGGPLHTLAGIGGLPVKGLGRYLLIALLVGVALGAGLALTAGRNSGGYSPF